MPENFHAGDHPNVAVGLIRFIAKNQIVIPIATIHLLWAIRLIPRP